MCCRKVNNFGRYNRHKHGLPCSKGCKNGDGSKLLLNLDLVDNIVKEVVKVSKVPVTVKIRLGWDREHIVAVEVAK